VILILQDAFNPKEFLTVDHHAVFLEKVRIHNHVRNSCLILQTQKDEALRCPWTLPSDYASRYPRVLPRLRQIAMRKKDYTDPHLGAWRAYYRALVEAGVYVAGDALEVPEKDRRKTGQDEESVFSYSRPA
jgi:hypothetical protein